MEARSGNTADALVIGGGVAGLSTALQLAGRGQRVILLEQGELGSGSTAQASGLLGQLRSTVGATRMMMESLATLEALQAEAGASILTRSGSLRVAHSPARAAELRQGVAVGQAAGLEVEMIDVAAARGLVPYMRADDLLAAAYCPGDVYLRPPELAALYVALGRRRDVDFRPGTRVERLTVVGERVTGCLAAGERFSAPVVVNAGGPWAHLVAEQAWQPLPTAAIGHCYFTIAPDPPVDPHSPSVRDYQNRIYSRPTREGGLQVGIYEARPVEFDMEAFSPDFRMAALGAEAFGATVAALEEHARRRFPLLDQPLPRRVTTGIMAWTPDGRPLCGPLPGVAGFYHSAGFCGHGVMQSAAVGLLMADLVLNGTWRYDPAELEADRFADFPELATRAAVKAGCRDAYANCYGREEAAPGSGSASTA